MSHRSEVSGSAADTAEPEPPRRPTSLSHRELAFVRRPAVRWFAPVLLATTAVRAVGAHMFGAYLDKRELQGALPADIYDHSTQASNDPVEAAESAGEGSHATGGGDFWLDYAADVGDGFNATYSIAWLLAQSRLRLDSAHTPGPLPRGHVLVLGGDEVYPAASSAAYHDRFLGPYRAALPACPSHPPSLYALPGNHDWYDGLTTFLRVFARRTPIGGWRTHQARSYFAIRLPHDWWLFAVDTELSPYIDEPQLRYFERAAEQLDSRHRVIVCVPAPEWAEAATDPDAYDPVDYFLRRIIAPTGARCSLLISGDKHHYARYERAAESVSQSSQLPQPSRFSRFFRAAEDHPPGTEGHEAGVEAGVEPATDPPADPLAAVPDHLITCGGGGAFLADTAHLPTDIEVPSPRMLNPQASRSRPYRLAQRFPSVRRSRRIAWGVLVRLPLRNPGFLAAVGIAHVLLLLTALAAHDRLLTPASAVAAGLVLATTIALSKPPAGASTSQQTLHRSLGIVHGITHLALAYLAAWCWTASAVAEAPAAIQAVAVVCGYGPLAAVVATEVVAAHLLLSGAFGINLNELFAGQGIADHKCLLRIRITEDGSLTVYPIKVERVSRRWSVRPNDAPTAPWIAPTRPLRPELIEDPVTIRGHHTMPAGQDSTKHTG